MNFALLIDKKNNQKPPLQDNPRKADNNLKRRAGKKILQGSP